mgnify:CR=1 FL=1
MQKEPFSSAHEKRSSILFLILNFSILRRRYAIIFFENLTETVCAAIPNQFSDL